MRKYTNTYISSCPWCHDGDRSKIEFSIIDDDFGQYVQITMIKFCPFCGKELR